VTRVVPLTSHLSKSLLSSVDLAVYVLILVIGAIELTYYNRATDFVADPVYPDVARSILEQRAYEFDFRPETTLPPAFS